jgi:uncharacterized protein (DUF2147 family)
MHKIMTLALIGLWAGPALTEDALVGLWKTALQDDGGYGFVQIAPCGAAFCGTLVKGVNSAGEVATSGGDIGRPILWDMQAAGDGHFTGGKIFSPDRNQTYGAKLKLDGDRLMVSGCVLGICRDGGLWVRQ